MRRRRVKRIDVAQGDEREDLIEQLCAATSCPSLEGKASGEERKEQQAGDGCFTGSCHATAHRRGEREKLLKRHLGSPSSFISGPSTQHVVHMPYPIVLPNAYITDQSGTQQHLMRGLQNPLQV